MATTLIEKLSDIDPTRKEEEETIYRNACALAYFAEFTASLTGFKVYSM
jgi:hypothetical protein